MSGIKVAHRPEPGLQTRRPPAGSVAVLVDPAHVPARTQRRAARAARQVRKASGQGPQPVQVRLARLRSRTIVTTTGLLVRARHGGGSGRRIGPGDVAGVFAGGLAGAALVAWRARPRRR